MSTALKWAMNHPHVDATITSMTDIDQLEDKVKSMNAPFTESARETLVACLTFVVVVISAEVASLRGINDHQVVLTQRRPPVRSRMFRATGTRNHSILKAKSNLYSAIFSRRAREKKIAGYLCVVMNGIPANADASSAQA